MKKLSKLMAALIALAGVFMMALPQAHSVAAAGATCNLVITKIVPTENNVMLNPINHDGTQKTLEVLGTALGQSITTLDGAGFTLYKVKDSSTTVTLAEADVAAGTATTIPQQLTANGGVATFTDLAYGTYLIKETTIPNGSQPVAIPAVITLPVTDASGTPLDTAYIYPKNIKSDITPYKTVDSMTNLHSTHNVGDVQTWYLQATVPANLANWEGLKFTDEFNSQLNYAGNVKINYSIANAEPVELATLQAGTHYTLTQPAVGTAGGTMVLEFTKAGLEAMMAVIPAATLSTTEIVVTVQTVINETAVMGTDIPNTYTLAFDNTIDGTLNYTDKPSNDPKVVTGGKKFVKVETGTETRLAGAEFVVQKLVEVRAATPLYLKVSGDQREWVETIGDATKFTTNAAGLIEVKGLEFSSFTNTDKEVVSNRYELVEVKAPAGYALLTAPIPFTVDASSYTSGDIASIPSGTVIDATKIENKKLSIPQTGGIGTAIFIVAGLAIMGGAVFAMKKENEKE